MTGTGNWKLWPNEPGDLWSACAASERIETRPDVEREGIIEEGLWVEHDVESKTREELASFVSRPWAPHQRWRGTLFVGDPGSGRSSIIESLRRNEGSGRRFVIARTPPRGTAMDFWSAFEPSLGWGSSKLGMSGRKREAINRLDQSMGLIMENGDVLADLPAARRRQVLALIKEAGEEAHLPATLVVTPRVSALIVSDEAWSTRFETVRLPRWRVDRHFLDLLTSWEALLPLQNTSHLADRDMALHLYSLCDGTIGRLSTILRTAALAAISSGVERITIPLLDNLDLSPPPSFRGFPF